MLERLRRSLNKIRAALRRQWQLDGYRDDQLAPIPVTIDEQHRQRRR